MTRRVILGVLLALLAGLGPDAPQCHTDTECGCTLDCLE